MINKKNKPNKVKQGVGAYDEALNFLTPKARSVRETENHLDECDYSEVEITQTIERLLGNGLLDERKTSLRRVLTRSLSAGRGCANSSKDISSRKS